MFQNESHVTMKYSKQSCIYRYIVGTVTRDLCEDFGISPIVGVKKRKLCPFRRHTFPCLSYKPIYGNGQLLYIHLTLHIGIIELINIKYPNTDIIYDNFN